MRLEKVKEFGGFDEVVGFMEALKEAYPMTPFYLVLPIILDDTAYKTVDLKLNHAVNSQGGAFVELKMFAPDYEKVEDFFFHWNTSSNHDVVIQKEGGKFYLYIGTDESRNFYKDIFAIAGMPVKREYLGKSKDGKVYRETFRGKSAIVEITDDGWIREYEEYCLKNLLKEE